MEIWWFKTSIRNHSDLQNLIEKLEHLENLKKWKIDMTSVDKILIVFADNISQEAILKAVESAGLKAEALHGQTIENYDL